MTQLLPTRCQVLKVVPPPNNAKLEINPLTHGLWETSRVSTVQSTHDVRALQVEGVTHCSHGPGTVQDMVLAFKMLCLVAILQRRKGESLSLLPSQSHFTWAAEIRGWGLQLTEKSQQPRLKETAARDASVRTYSLIINAEFFVTCVASVGWLPPFPRAASILCAASLLPCFVFRVYFSSSLCFLWMWQL